MPLASDRSQLRIGTLSEAIAGKSGPVTGVVTAELPGIGIHVEQHAVQ